MKIARLSFLISCSLFTIFFLNGCHGASVSQKTPETFTTVLWNVQNLFDGEDNGNEYPEFREAGGWTPEKYAARITAISQALAQNISQNMTGLAGAPDLIGFVEVENLKVLEDLAAALSKHGYYWAAFANIPGAPVGVGAISRYPITDIRAHSITIDDQTAPRPVLELRVEPRPAPEEPLVFLLCHWKSKTGGEDATAAQRRASARVVQRRFLELRQSGADTPVIVMGDLNENHDEFRRRRVVSALLPDDPDAAALASQTAPAGISRQDYLVLSAEKPPRANYFPEETHAFYSPWIEDKSGGSYYFRDNWESIDHFLLSDNLFTGQGWEYAGSHVLNQAPFTAPSGEPNRYIPRSGQGLSDHLPLLLYLDYKH